MAPGQSMLASLALIHSFILTVDFCDDRKGFSQEQDMRTLLQALWPHATSLRGAVTFWLFPSKKSYHVALEDALNMGDEDEAEMASLGNEKNVYFGLGLRALGLSQKQQGGKKDIVALPAVALDIDFYDEHAHAAKNLPRDLDEAAPLIEHLPDPSVVVHTGNGVHVYWCFIEPIILDTTSRQTQAQRALKSFQEPIIQKAKDRGWHLDSTASIQHVWRVPGFVNQKNNKPVELVHCDASWRYDLQSLQIRMPERREPAVEAPPRQQDIEPLRNALLRVDPSNRFYAAIQAALEGVSMSPPGKRDETLQGVCSTIAWLPEGRNADPAYLAEILRPSLSVWACEEGATKTVEEELGKAADKIARSQEDYRARQEAARPQLDGIAAALGLGLDGEEANEFFLRHAIVQYRATFYIFDFRTHQYSVARTRDEIIPFARDAWAEGPENLSLTYENDKGQTKQKSAVALCQQYCTVVDSVVGDMTIEESRLSMEERVFYEATAKKRIADARFDERIDEWLRLLAGDKYDKVCDWIAGVPQLEHQCCALYIDGISGAGKGLLANGLARLWRRGAPTPFINVIGGDFNEELVRCPLVWIDEGVPGRRGNITAELRALVGRSSFTLSEKFLSSRIVQGCVRLMICANNENVLLFGDTEMSTSDLEAVVGRILHVHAHREAAEWLGQNNDGGALTRSWVEGDLIARHCLYLAENRDLVPGKRFLVEGDETQMHRKLVMQGETNGLVYEWLVRFATNPDAVTKAYRAKNQQPLALIGDGMVLVNTQCVIDCWRLYMPEDVRRPSTTRIGRVLGRLASMPVRAGKRGDRARYHAIKADMILEWCREQQIGNEGRIEENLKNELEIEE